MVNAGVFVANTVVFGANKAEFFWPMVFLLLLKNAEVFVVNTGVFLANTVVFGANTVVVGSKK